MLLHSGGIPPSPSPFTPDWKTKPFALHANKYRNASTIDSKPYINNKTLQKTKGRGKESRKKKVKSEIKNQLVVHCVRRKIMTSVILSDKASNVGGATAVHDSERRR